MSRLDKTEGRLYMECLACLLGERNESIEREIEVYILRFHTVVFYKYCNFPTYYNTVKCFIRVASALDVFKDC